MKRRTGRFWLRSLLYGLLAILAFIVFVFLPIAGSYIITNARFRYPERGPKRPDEVGLSVTPAEFNSEDSVPLKGWWNAGDPNMPVILFCHGLNRSRLEMLERGAEAHRRGYGVLLFDLRNHGESGRGYTTLGVHESRDVCAAKQYVNQQAGNRPQVLWGVSMGASTALLAAARCPGFAAIVSDSSFLSFRETIAHHLNLAGIPSFPIANLIIAVTGWRAGFDPDDGDVERAVHSIGNVPILFIAGGKDRRMPPATAKELLNAAQSPQKQLLVVPEAGHGEAFQTDRTGYLAAVFGFLQNVAKPRS